MQDPLKDLSDLIHQYVPAHSLERVRALLVLVAAGATGNDVAWLVRAWQDATGAYTPSEARRKIVALEATS